MDSPEHHRHAPQIVALAILTVSDTRTVDTDESGSLARRLVEAAGHRVFDTMILPDEPGMVRAKVSAWLAEEGCDGVIVVGGTGISARDRTYEAVAGLLEKRLDGFGELFRFLSFARVGATAMLSRAVGGIADQRVVFSVPGSPAAVGLALEKLILPELGHLLSELRKHRDPH